MIDTSFICLCRHINGTERENEKNTHKHNNLPVLTADTSEKNITETFAFLLFFFLLVRLLSRQFLISNHVKRRPCWWSIQKKILGKICIKIEFISQRRKTLLFLTTNMAALTSLANQQFQERTIWND